jgi:transcriptional regulator with XRE-family HTH domain
METVGQKLVNIRKNAGFSQKELAALLKRSSSYISRIESGERPPTPALVTQILKTCRKNVGWTDNEYQDILKEMNSNLRTLDNLIKDDSILHINFNYGDYTGTYWFYTFASTGQEMITVNEINIEKKLDTFQVYSKNLYFNFEYKGELVISEQNIFMMLDGTSANRKIFCIFHNPISRKLHRLWGVSASISMAYEPTMKYILLSDEMLDEKSAVREFEKRGYNFENAIFKIPKDVHLVIENLSKR